MADFDITSAPSLQECVSRAKDAKRRIEEAENDYRQAQADYALLVEAEIARQVGEENVRRLARWAYWNTEVAVDVLATAVRVAGGPSLTVVKFSKWAGASDRVFSCQRCGTAMVPTSRNQAGEWARADRSSGGSSLMCESCKLSEEQSRQQQWHDREALEAVQLQRLREMPYRQYLRTEHWQSFRASRIRSAGYRCQLCNGGGLLDVHHRTYDRRGCEHYADVIVLCRGCHAKHHDKIPSL